MGRQRDPKRDEAFNIYKASGGKVNLNVIAAQLGVGDGTVRGWKAKDNWDNPETKAKLEARANGTGRNGTLHKKKKNAPKNTERNVKNKNVPKKDKSITLDEIENDELTDKQRLFCIYYLKCFNATQAAIKAGYSADTAYSIGPENLNKPVIANEIKRLKSKMTNTLFVEAMDVLNVYLKIAFADVTDYLTFGQKEVPVMTMFGPMMEGEGDNKKPVTKIVNFVDFKPSDEIDGTLISEIKQGKDGVGIKFSDKMKALEKLEKYFDLLPDTHKRMLEDEKLKMDRERLELDKAKAAGEGDLDEELIDDWVGAVMDDGADEQEG